MKIYLATKKKSEDLYEIIFRWMNLLSTNQTISQVYETVNKGDELK